MRKTISVILFLIINSYSFPVFSSELPEKIIPPEKTEYEELLLFFEESVITATKTKKRVRDVPAIMSVITAKEIRDMGARDLIDVLRIATGLNISKTRHGVWQIEVRGVKSLNTDKVLILQDGHVLNFPFDGGATRFFGDLVVNNIKQIEIIRGPGSALYGANAFLAVINIITKKAEDIDGFEIKGGGGSFGTWSYNILFGKEIDELKVDGYIDFIDTNGSRMNVERDILSPASFSDAPGHTLDWKQKKDLNLKLSWADFTLWGKYMEQERGSYIGVNYAINDESELVHKSIRGELSYKHTFIRELDVLARFYGSEYYLNYFWEIFPEGYLGVFPEGFLGNPEVKNRTIGGELKLDYKLFEINKITFGSVYENIYQYDVKSFANFNPQTGAPLPGGYQDVSDWANFNKNVNRDVYAFYLQNDLDLLSDYGVNLLLGVRHDIYPEFGGATSPRLGVTWRFIPEMDLKALYGEAFRAPSFEELYNRNNPAVLGNSDLDPETLWTTDVELSYRLLPDMNIRLGYFHTEINNLIRLNPISTGERYENKGGADIDGLDTEVSIKSTNGHYVFANYTYQETREFGEPLPGAPKHLLKAGLNLNFWNYLNSNTTYHFIGPRPRAEDDPRDKLSSYSLVNQTFIFKNFFKTLELRLSIYNLFNENYEVPAPAQTLRNDFPQPERHYFFEAGLKF